MQPHVRSAEGKPAFVQNKFALVEEENTDVDLSQLKLAARYAQLPKPNLACTVLQMLLPRMLSTVVDHAGCHCS